MSLGVPPLYKLLPIVLSIRCGIWVFSNSIDWHWLCDSDGWFPWFLSKPCDSNSLS